MEKMIEKHELDKRNFCKKTGVNLTDDEWLALLEVGKILSIHGLYGNSDFTDIIADSINNNLSAKESGKVLDGIN